MHSEIFRNHPVLKVLRDGTAMHGFSAPQRFPLSQPLFAQMTREQKESTRMTLSIYLRCNSELRTKGWVLNFGHETRS